MEQIKTVTVEKPGWLQEKGINEQAFCRHFLHLYPMKFCDGSFYGLDGWISEEKVKRQIFGLINQFVIRNIAKVVNQLLEALRFNCMVEKIPVQETKLHCSNGTYNLSTDEFTPHKEICRCRLPVAFRRDAPEPKQWLKFLSELLYEEDIITLQEFMGYCLFPANYAQRMLLIIGNGGEGKSRIGIVLSALLGQYMVNGSLSKLESSPFARADLQNRLVMVDDDLRLEALTTTNYIKSIVTAEHPMDLEKKGQQSYQGLLYCRLMAFGNGTLRSLHDRSHGFFRRQIILTTRVLDPSRVDDPFLARRIIRDELDGVFMWALEGFLRLLGNDLKFYVSPRARENIREAIAEGNNIPEFLASTGYIRKDPMGCITSRQLYRLYRDWCQDNEVMSLPSKSFSSYLISICQQENLTYTNSINAGNGRMVRGFRGIRAADAFYSRQ